MEKRIITALLLLAFCFLLHLLYQERQQRVRLENWNGKRFCLLGYVPVYQEGSAFAMKIGESMVDLSHTTLYRICLPKRFFYKNRYRDLYLYIQDCRQYLLIEEKAMKTEIPFSEKFWYT